VKAHGILVSRPYRARWAAALAAGALLVSLTATQAASVSASPIEPTASAALRAADDFPPELAPFYTQVLVWTPCDGGLQCSSLTVPLDYANPSAGTIQLKLNKARATGGLSNRQGSLVINPGGPGGSGLEFTAYAAQVIAPRVNQQFDFVSFDPRGVGESAPITCLTGRQTTVWLRLDGTPDTRVEERRLMTLASGIPRGCLAKSPDLARHVGSEDTVKDIDILRQALGEPKLNWLGFSYGTLIGTLYTEAFPDRVGRFVLDGALDPANNLMQVSQGQSHGFQVAISRFAADCASRPHCPYAGSAKAVLRGINRLLARLEVRSMPAEGRERLTQADALSAVFYSMYSPQLWSSLRIGLQMASEGNGSGLMAIADNANDRTGPNTYANNMVSAFYATSCWDVPATPDAAGLRAAAAQWSRFARVPEMAKAMSWGNAPCSQWYGHTARQPAPASTTTTAPILVVGTIYDPATPYPWAVALSKQLTTSTLLTFVGDGHTAYGSGSRCIDRAVDAYLLTGAPPASGTVCN
jgi:pimeloyl-ACP methyl ester carboxylesterase